LQKHFLHYTQRLKRCELAQQHVQVSQENVAAALTQYRLGCITLLALDKARQNDQETTLKYLQAIYDAKVTEVALQKLGGTLLDVAY
jgi:outer membrane protein TolC